MTPSPRTSAASRTGSTRSVWSAITTRAPVVSAPHSSQTEKSNANECAHSHTSSAVVSSAAGVGLNNAYTPPWPTITPFGVPVEPDV